MRCSGCVIGSLLAGFCLLAGSGCVSLDDHSRLKAANRRLEAGKLEVDKDLFDERSVTEALRNRSRSLEHDLEVKTELVDNYRRENELLDEMRKSTQRQLEDMVNQDPGPIAILGPKLPESLDNALNLFAKEHSSQVIYEPSAGTVKWNADLLFALGSDVVKQSPMKALAAFAAIIKSPAARDFEVIVVGHTDDRPIVRLETKAKHPTNWHLSAHRAIAVSNVLQRQGYAPGRVSVMGCGEYRPVSDNATEAGNSENRRVEIYLVPTGSIVHAAAKSGWYREASALPTNTP